MHSKQELYFLVAYRFIVYSVWTLAKTFFSTSVTSLLQYPSKPSPKSCQPSLENKKVKVGYKDIHFLYFVNKCNCIDKQELFFFGLQVHCLYCVDSATLLSISIKTLSYILPILTTCEHFTMIQAA